MKYNFALATLATVVAASEQLNPILDSRQTDNTEEYIQEVCFPNTTSPVPPCQAILNIESACLPNGTSTLAYEAHQQCMCNGGYFPNWRGCLNCQYVHGTRSEAVAEAFDNILSSASQQFCTGTPTAVFADYFSALSDSSPQTATGVATTTSDQFPSQSAVSLYYTASGNQGPGAITGSAAQATATASAVSGSSGSLAASAATTSAARSSGASSGARSSSMTSARSSSGSSSGSAASAASTSAAQTGAANAVAVSEGLLAVVAGAMMLL
ncbi:hypothetical protein D6D01_05198 [Aureobasidium pullulans]|uniref:Uncharacterized protein n=1 Tax=Aureobasidium pullulans TaxID=5580 RepID=A0A4S9L8D2_AURPU|nr:hypothetical protein D6D01_05198 [Aureobasidium pullulans]